MSVLFPEARVAMTFEAQASGFLHQAAFALFTDGDTQSLTLELRELSDGLPGAVRGSVTLGVGQFFAGFGSSPENYSVFDFTGENVWLDEGTRYAWTLSALGGWNYVLVSTSSSFTSSDPAMVVYTLDEETGWMPYAPPHGLLHTASVVIPEPGSAAALAGMAALAGVVLRRRRR